jgi:endonuclease YncB( thermonuclease family)
MDKKQILAIGLGGLFVLLALGVSGAAALHRLGLQATATPTPSLTVTTKVVTRSPSTSASPSSTPVPEPTTTPLRATPTPPGGSSTPGGSRTPGGYSTPGTDIWLPYVADIATPTQTTASSGFACLQTEPQQAEVASVVDGDTIHVTIGDQGFSLRYIGVDSPEEPDPSAWLGAEATAKNRLLLGGKQVLLFKDTSETDAFGRLLRYVLLEDGTFVNLEMVRAGLAQARAYPPDTACRALFEGAEEQARQAALGLWSATPAPVAAAPETATPDTAAASPAQATCNCRGPDLDCSDFSSQAEAQTCFEACQSQGRGDIFRLDGDRDGRVCERLP